MRENPDVVLVGEMRDYETFEAAIRAAETGHLVFGTIHASSAWQTFGRIYDLFPENEREQIRKLLAYNLRAIIYQKLLPTLHAHIARIPAIEILINNPAVQKYILEGREGELLEIIKRSHDEGMLDFTSALVKLVEDNYIHQRIALEATPKPEELKMRLNTDVHDYQVRLRAATRFSGKGDKVKLSVAFRGRELEHRDDCRVLFEKFVGEVEASGVEVAVQSPPAMQGRTMSMILGPAKAKP